MSTGLTAACVHGPGVPPPVGTQVAVAPVVAVRVAVTVTVRVVVDVATGVPQIWPLKVRVQQPIMLPRSPPRSSTTYRFHTPLALVPSNTDRVDVPAGAGAGAGKVSPVPILVGWYVPDTI